MEGSHNLHNLTGISLFVTGQSRDESIFYSKGNFYAVDYFSILNILSFSDWVILWLYMSVDFGNI